LKIIPIIFWGFSLFCQPTKTNKNQQKTNKNQQQQIPTKTNKKTTKIITNNDKHQRKQPTITSATLANHDEVTKL
jgi:hypothetical protein